jgi:hypothetical protein
MKRFTDPRNLFTTVPKVFTLGLKKHVICEPISEGDDPMAVKTEWEIGNSEQLVSESKNPPEIRIIQ